MERPLDENAYGEVTSRAAKALLELFRRRRSDEDKDKSAWAKGKENWAKKGYCDHVCGGCMHVKGCCTQDDLIEVGSSGRGLTFGGVPQTKGGRKTTRK